MNEDPLTRHRLSSFHVWALAFGCIIGWGAFVMPGTTFLPLAGPAGTAIALGAAAIVMIIIAINYRSMIVKYPANGNTFVTVLETFGHKHGFVCAWALTLAYLALVPQNVTALGLIARSLMGNLLEFGLHYNAIGYEIYLGEVVFVAIVLTVLIGLASRGARVMATLQVVFVMCTVVGVAVLGIAAVASPVASLENVAPAFSPMRSAPVGIICVVAVAPWAFLGFDTVAQSAGEFAFPVRKIGIVMIGAIVLGAVMYCALNMLAASVVPPGYDGWPAYVASLDELTGVAAIPVFYAVEQVLGQPGIVILAVATFGAVLSSIVGFTRATSRLLYATARAGMLPAWFAKVDSRRNMPLNATVFVCLIALVASLLGRTILTWIVDMSAIGAAVAFFYTSAAAWTHARHEGKPAIVATGIAGMVFSAVFALLLLLPVPVLGSSLGFESYVFLIAWIALGVNFYIPKPKKKRDIAIGSRLTAMDSEQPDVSDPQ